MTPATNSTTYNTIHQWNIRHWPKKHVCEHCGATTAKRYEWSNKSGEYRRDRDDWQELCRSCHIKYDREVLGINWSKGRPKGSKDTHPRKKYKRRRKVLDIP